MKKLGQFGIFIVVGILSFFLFLFMFFPYQILKEAISLKASEATGMSIAIDSLSLKLPFGLNLKGVSVVAADGKEMQFEWVTVAVKTLPLFLGSLGVQVDLIDNGKGYLNAYVKTGIPSLLSGRTPSLERLQIDAANFRIGELIDFTISALNQEEVFSSLLKPLLESIDIDGKMASSIDLTLDFSNPQKTNGILDLSFQGLAIKSLNENIPLPEQNFQKAAINASIKNGTIAINAGKSGFSSQDLLLNFNGEIQQKSQITSTVLDLGINVTLGAGLTDHLGIVLDAVAQKETGGKMEIKIKGPVAGPAVTFE